MPSSIGCCFYHYDCQELWGWIFDPLYLQLDMREMLVEFQFDFIKYPVGITHLNYVKLFVGISLFQTEKAKNPICVVFFCTIYKMVPQEFELALYFVQGKDKNE